MNNLTEKEYNQLIEEYKQRTLKELAKINLFDSISLKGYIRRIKNRFDGLVTFSQALCELEQLAINKYFNENRKQENYYFQFYTKTT